MSFANSMPDHRYILAFVLLWYKQYRLTMDRDLSNVYSTWQKRTWNSPHQWAHHIPCRVHGTGGSSETTIRLFVRYRPFPFPWWRHHMDTFAASLAIYAGNSPVTGEFPAQRPVTRSFDVFFDLRLNKWLSKQSWGWWFETPPHPLWRHCNVRMAKFQMAIPDG